MNHIAYYRVSTQKQGRSGLGLEAQRAAVTAYLRGNEPVAEFTEIESGRKRKRPELKSALEACDLYGATLVVAKLDRLARNAAFLLQLQESGVRFVCCDMPDANELTVGILALVAQDEAKRISERTKAALAAAKARGTKLGNPKNLRHRSRGRERSRQVRMENARARASRVAPVIQRLQREGMSLRAVAAELTRRRIPTSRGGRWSADAVSRTLKLAACASELG